MTTCIDTLGFIFSKSKVTIKSYRTGRCKYKLALFKLTKNDFISSTMSISTSADESWEYLKANIIDLINKDFMISVTKCSKLHSFGARLAKIKECKCCDIINLYFYYNVIPGISSNCTNLNSICIPLVCNTNQPNVSCYPENYWPDPNPDTQLPYYPPGACANIVGNFFYSLDCGNYSDVKFYIQSVYCTTPCFKQACVTTCN
jgi:hypothetical protein